MCGILGYFGNDVDKFARNCKLKTINHRGPDNLEEVIGENYYLGHARLSIQDVSNVANQPMFTKDRKGVLIFNGEIYNHKELRSKYLSEFEFLSSGDTETLLYGLRKYGVNFIDKLNGIFAFSYLNLETNDFIISKDHFGVKPLYYYLNETEISFSSELKSIKGFSENPMKIDQGALKNYINFLWSPGENTPVKEFKKILPGHYVTGNINNINKIKFNKYYSVPFKGEYFTDVSEKELIDKLEKHLIKAVERQMLSDVPIGFFLSGGLDSSLLVAIARKLNPKKEINCYTIEMESTDGFADDLPYAKKVADYLNVNLTNVKAGVDILEYFDKVIYHLDEPQADPAPIHVYNICKQARKDGIKVLIGGTAGDDVFSGLRRHEALKFESYIENVPILGRRILKNIAPLFNKKNNFGRRLNKISANIEKSKNERLLGYYSWLNTDIIDSLFLKSKKHNYYSYFNYLNDLIPLEKSDLNKMLFWEINTFLVDHNLNYTDKLSMATGVEVRVPFLDVELVNFSTKIPPELKLKGNETKYILKKVAERYLPKDVIYRSKTGFGAPVREWIINDMDLLINNYLSKKTINKRGIFCYKKISELIKKNKKGKIDASYSIWSLLAIESWMKQFYD